MNISDFQYIYFLGVGGIGMSALARYFLSKDKKVAGYDLTETKLTEELSAEGVDIHYKDDVSKIPSYCLDKDKTLVILTPAIPHEHSEYTYFRDNEFVIKKRAQVLGMIVNEYKPLCVAGTHGKTTTSTMLAYILECSDKKCNAFLGGISKNFGSNLLINHSSDLYVVEADEFDRSFHNLFPYMTVVTSMDPDHLDIYGSYERYIESFNHYVSQVRENGVVIKKHNLELDIPENKNIHVYTYSKDEGDFHSRNVRIDNGDLYFDFIGPDIEIRDIRLGVPLYINIENSVAAIAMAILNGVSEDIIKYAVSTFAGVMRRFDFMVKDDRHVFINDYAHHPVEIKNSIESVRFLYPDRKIMGVFQPHLYSRTRDLYKEFADSLSLLDDVIVLEIYPARELPIDGVSSELILNNIKQGVKKELCSKNDLLSLLKKKNIDVLMTIGAGNIDTLAPQIIDLLKTV